MLSAAFSGSLPVQGAEFSTYPAVQFSGASSGLSDRKRYFHRLERTR